MNRNLKALLLTALTTTLLCWLVLVYGCDKPYEGKMAGACRHEATYAAVVMGERYPVRVVGGIWSLPGKPGVLHAIAQAQISGKWEWLCVQAYPEVKVCEEDPNFRATTYYTPQTWWDYMYWRMKS